MFKIALLNVFFLVVGLGLGTLAVFSLLDDDVSAPQEDSEPTVERDTELVSSPEPAPVVSLHAETVTERSDPVVSPDEIGSEDPRITGIVLTKNGEPFEGASVSATPIPDRKRSNKKPQTAGDREPDGSADQVADRVQETRNTRKQTVTDSRGEFSLTDLQDDRYEIHITAPGHEISRDGRLWIKAHPGDHLEFLATTIIKVPVEIVLPDGEEPSVATVRYTQHKENGSLGSTLDWSAQDPVVDLYAGDFTLSVTSKHGGRRYVSRKQRVSILPDTTPEGLRFELTVRLGMKGKVTFPKGEAPRHADVVVIAGEQDQEVNPKLWKRPDKKAPIWPTEYSYRLQIDEPGTYHVGVARSRGLEPVVYETVEVSDGIVLQDLEVPPLKPSEYVVVWALDSDGEVLDRVYLSTGRRTEKRSASRPALSFKREDGAHLVLHYEGDDEDWLKDAFFFVEVESPFYGRKTVQYRAAEKEEIQVQFDDPASLDVTMDGYIGSGLEGMLSLSVKQLRGKRSSRKGRPKYRPGGHFVNSLGRVKFDILKPGEAEVVVSVKTKSGSQHVARGHPVVLKVGENHLEIPVPALHSLTVLFPETIAPGTGVKLDSADRGHRFFDGGPNVGEDRRVVFEELPAGEYTVSILDLGGSGQMNVSLAQDLEVVFEPRAINALRVSIQDPDGALARAGFEDGDLIIGFDQVKFESMGQMQLAFSGALTRALVSFTVLRGERQMEIPIEPAKIIGSNNHGGRIDPASR